MGHTEKLADFCSSVKYDSLPDEVISKAKQCILDFLANVYGSLELEAVNNIVDYIRSLEETGRATALGCGFTTGMQNAAFINGTSAEAIEAQDGLRFGGNHPGTAVIPAALALAEKEGLGGKAVIEAVVAGYEAADRAAASVHPHHTLSGFLPTGTCGTFGAAAAAGRLFGFSGETMTNALGNAGFLVPLSMAEQLMGGFTVKIVQGGQAASAGLMAAGLAYRGITGAGYVFEGSDLGGGFCQITTRKTGGEPNLERLSEGLGDHYTIMDIYFKPYTACRHTHGVAQAVLELKNEKKIAVEDIKSIEVKTYGIASIAVGKGVSLNDSIVNAQFSIPYVTAACIMDGELGPGQLTEKRLSDKGVIDLAGKVTVESDDDMNSLYPGKTASRVTVFMKDGTILEKQVDIPKGDPRDPMTDETLADKTRLFAGKRDQEKVNRAIELALNLEKCGSIRELTGSV